jgi:membrane protease YdiL (CAAX protease family)
VGPAGERRPLSATEPRRPDWYADPLGRHSLRYWDGDRWTERVSDGGRLGTDPADAELAEWLAQRGGEQRAAWPGWVAPSSVAVAIAAIAGANLAARLVDDSGASAEVVLAVGGLTLYGALLAFCWFVRRRVGTARGMRFDFAFVFKASDVGWGFLVSVAGRLAAVALVLPLIFIDEDYVVGDTDRFEGVGDDLPVLIGFTIVAVVMAPIFEELFFRGLLQRALEGMFPTALAIGIASLLFGFAHLSTEMGRANVGVVAATGAAGAVLGVTVHVTRRLGRAVVAHAIFNIVPVLTLWAE